MKSKLGCYLIDCGDLPVEWFAVAQPRIAVSMSHNFDYWQQVKRVSPSTFVLGRFYLDDSQQTFDTPVSDAEWFYMMMLADAQRMRPVYDAWMAINEPVINGEQDARNLSAFTAHWGGLMREAGLKSAAYSFSEGNCALELWPYLADGLRACDYLCLHEYDAPTMDRTQGWRCLRYRAALKWLPEDLRNKQIIIGECGIDGGVGGIDRPREGWTKFGSEAQYVDTLRWYDGELQKDPQVIGAAIFAARWGTGNGTYDIADARQIRDYIAQGQPEPLPPVPEPPPVVPAEPIYELTADKTSIVAGQPVTLSWHVENVREAYLDGEGITGPRGSKLVTPQASTIYTLKAVLPNGWACTRTLFVEVTEVAPPGARDVRLRALLEEALELLK